MVRLHKRAQLALLCILLPCLALMPFGALWLWEHQWLVYAGIGWLLLAAVAVLVTGRPRRPGLKTNAAFTAAEVEPDAHWPPVAEPAWDAVTEFANAARRKDYPLTDYNRLLQLGRETIELVARQFFPESAKPLLEIDIRSLLRIVEFVSHDLNQEISAKFPASHLIKIGWIPKAHYTARLGQKAWQGYRVSSMIINPLHALTQELRNHLLKTQVMAPMFDELQDWLLAWYVKKVGYYAIALYSGTLNVSDPAAQPTRYSKTDFASSDKQAAATDAEPLRILILGQVKSGKSSLINALTGEVRAATDVLPCTAKTTPYRWQREDRERALVLDTEGYGELQPGHPIWNKAQQSELLQVDLILLVVSAIQAARQADYQHLVAIRKLFDTHLKQRIPPVIVVLTHIDQLRPLREWAPPYDVQEPQRRKELNIRSAMLAVAADLNLAPDDVVPVCLRPGDEYNVKEGLLLTIMGRLDEASRVKYLRCLLDQQSQHKWSLLWEQLRHTGQILGQVGKHWLNN